MASDNSGLKINRHSDIYDLIRENYTSYANAPREFKEFLPNAIDALSACIVQCNDKREDHRKKIYSDFSDYVSKESGVPLRIVEKSDGARVIIKRKKSLMSIFNR